MTVITTVLQLLIPVKLLNYVYKGCLESLKMVKLTASSQIHSPYQAPNAVKNSYGWQSSIRNDKQWLQVDLGKKTDVKGISTQGRLNAHHWVKAYTISYSDDGTNFKPYMNDKV